MWRSGANLDGTYVGGIVLYDDTLADVAASVDITSVPATFHTLVLDVLGRGDTVAVAVQLRLRFNNDSGNNYDSARIYKSGASSSPTQDELVAQSSGRLTSVTAASATAGKPGMGRLVIPNYAGTTFQKIATATGGRFEDETGGGAFVTQEDSLLWRSTAAINRITILPAAGNFIAGSRFVLTGFTGGA